LDYGWVGDRQQGHSYSVQILRSDIRAHELHEQLIVGRVRPRHDGTLAEKLANGRSKFFASMETQAPATGTAFLVFLRQASSPMTARPLAKSGSGTGRGIGVNTSTWVAAVPLL